MATFTTNQTGNWSASSTWTATPPSGGPGIGDTVVFGGAHTVTIDSAAGPSANGIVKLGTGSGTCLSGSTTGTCTLVIANGNQLWLRGNAISQSGGLFYFSVGTTAGASLIFDPPNNSTQFSITTASGFGAFLASNGTTGQHSTIKTDFTRASGSGVNGFIGDQNRGVYLATYTDFTNLGTSSAWGVCSNAWASDPNPDVTITNCTFTNSNYQFIPLTGYNWDHNLTFQNNSFTSSVGQLADGSHNSCADFAPDHNGSVGTRLVDSNSFDLAVYSISRQIKWTNNCFGGGTQFQPSSAWVDDTYFNNNFVYFDDSSGEIVELFGSAKNCVFYNTHAGGHYILMNVAGSINNCLFMGTGASGNGDLIFPADDSNPSSFKYNICLPSTSTGQSPGVFLSCVSNTQGAITCEHNTYAAYNNDGGMIRTNETLSNYVGEIASCRGNIIWSPSATSKCWAIGVSSSGTNFADAVTVAGYNGFFNPNTGTDLWNTSTSQSGVTGYDTVKTAVNHNFPNTAIGTGDIVGDPQFVDSTRILETWDTMQGGPGTAADALAKIAANTALIAQATTGVLAWIRAGWAPTNSAYQNASYPADSSTVDAAGTSWPGGGPGIGAIAYVAAAPVSFDGPPYPIFASSPTKAVAAGWV